MPSVSKSQQRLMGVAYAVKSGDMELSDVDPAYRDKVKSLSDGMTKKDLKKYASTKHDKLPETVDEAFIGPYVFNDKMSDEELKAMYVSALDGYAYYQKGMHYAKSDYKKAYQEIEKILKKRGVSVDETVQQTMITPDTIGGMGAVKLPSAGELGSGDIPHTLVQVADIDDEEEAKKQKGTVKNLQAEELALTFKAFLNEQNEATDYNDPVLIRLRQAKLRRADMAKLDAMKKEAEKNRKKAMKRWNQKKYDQWLEDVAANDGWKNAFDMAQNAEFEPGLIDWVKKEFPYDDALQRIQWDIEAFAESVVTEGKYEDMLDQGDGHVHFIVKDEAAAEKLADAIEAKNLGDCDFYPEGGKIYLRVSFSVGYSGKEVSNLKKVEKLVGMKAQAGSPEVWAADESVVTEAQIRVHSWFGQRKEFRDWLKKHKVEVVSAEGEDGKDTIELVLTGKTKDLKKILKSDHKFGWDDKQMWAYIEEAEVNEKKLDRDAMIKWIEKYMDFVRTTEEFNGSQGGIWVSGENGDEYKGRVIYDYYSEDYKNRTFGVDNKWEKELNKRGWYSEWHDAGTSMIWPL